MWHPLIDPVVYLFRSAEEWIENLREGESLVVEDEESVDVLRISGTDD